MSSEDLKYLVIYLINYNYAYWLDNSPIFQIREMEDRRKVVACLELCGKSDNDIMKMLDGADKRGDLGMDAFVPQRIQDYIDKAKVCIQYRGLIQYCF